jgi:AraC-like DNA-binding protein
MTKRRQAGINLYMNTSATKDDQSARLAALIGALAVREGKQPTPVPGVEVSRTSHPTTGTPVVYEPMILFIAQGRKIGYLGGEVYRYDKDNFLALSVPIPFECKVEATPEEPVLALIISVDPTMLGEILINLDEPASSNTSVPRGIYSSSMTNELRGAAVRLLECLSSPVDSRILGPQTVREIVYRVLSGQQGGALRAMATRNDQFMRIARVLQYIHSDFARPLSTDELAKQARMSTSTFHQNFKAVTATSPLQYLKNIRLHRARLLMVNEGHNASTAAVAVGYESASQFGREFKRFFGGSPAEEAAKLRARLTASKGETLDRWVPAGTA